tara:strand:- start:78 stop:359 length:282 start_codon:yes stop_codon:yes gene_type:complete
MQMQIILSYKERSMLKQKSKLSTLEWLESQVSILDYWIEDVLCSPEADISLLECIQGHRKWLDSELKILKNPNKYRLPGFARHAIYVPKRIRD